MIIQVSQSIAAGATFNAFAGQQYEFLPFNANVQIGINGSAIGFVATLFAGTDLVMQESPINTQNRFPVYPDDFITNINVGGGTRMLCNIRNTTGGALTVFFQARLLQL